MHNASRSKLRLERSLSVVVSLLLLLNSASLANHHVVPLPSLPGTLPTGTVANVPAPPTTEAEAKKRAVESYGRLPLSFEANSSDPHQGFLSRGKGYEVFLSAEEMVFSIRASKTRVDANSNRKSVATTQTLKMKLRGANHEPRLVGQDQLPNKTNYFIGDDPAKWRTNVANYAKVKYESVYPGVDLIYYGTQDELKYDFVVSPHAETSAITLSFEGARKVRIDKDGNLLLTLPRGEVKHHKPLVYQTIGGSRQLVEARYRIVDRRYVQFEIGHYDKSASLVIDPAISYSTFLGGSGSEQVFDIAIDATGHAYITGMTGSTNFPTFAPFQSSNGGVGTDDVFVSKLNPAGNALIYSTYLGGSGGDVGNSLAVDSSGCVYLAGSTQSTNFPKVNPYQSSLRFTFDGFVAKLDATGGTLLYSTYFGGSVNENLRGIAVDSLGNAYVVGWTTSSNFPLVNPIQAVKGGSNADAIIAKFGPTGSTLLYSTYLGGNDEDVAYDITLDSSNNIIVTGTTESLNYYLMNPLQSVFGGGGRDAFVTKLNPQGNLILYSSYLGGNGNEDVYSMALDTAGLTYVTGRTTSTNFPSVNAFQNILKGSNDAYVAKFDTTTPAYVYSTYLGGTSTDYAEAVTADSSGNAYVVGQTASTNFPVVNALQGHGGGTFDAFLTKLSPTGETILFSTFIGGSSSEIGEAVAVDEAGNVYFGGSTGSANFPLVNPIQSTQGGFLDAFVMKLTGLTTYNITGRVNDSVNGGVSAVTMTLSGSESGTTQTDANGNYAFFNLTAGGNYTVTPSKNSATFSPSNRTFNNLSNNVVGNFSITTYTIGGQVTNAAGAGAEAITITLSGSQSATTQTDSAGNYSFSNIWSGGSYTVTPSKAGIIGYNFTPPSQSYSDLTGNQVANFSFTNSTNLAVFPIADAYVEDGANAAVNFGTVTPMLLKTANQTGQRRDVYVKYDLSTVSRKITNAKLRIFARLSAAGSVSTTAYGVTDTGWSETGINWNNKPARNAAISTVAVTSTTFATYELDVTSYILNEQAAGRDVISLALHNDSNSTPHILVNAREATTNKPQLLLTTLDANNAAPTVNLTSPTGGGSYTAPASVPLQATASDSDGSISKVEFYAGTDLIGTVSSSPYNTTWANVGVGSYTITAVATDNQGLRTVSNGAQITVTNGNVLPVVSITEPLSNTTFAVGPSITLSATASDADGSVTQVQFFSGTTSLGTDTTAPYSISWNNAAAGIHSLTARATDNNGGVTTSAPVTVNRVWQTGFSPLADTYVKDGSTAGTNFGTATELQVQQGASGSNRDSYLRFDVGAIAGTNTIARARLRVFGKLSDTSGTNVEVGVHSVSNTSWGETSISWNTKPAVNNPALSTTTITDTAGRWYEFDVSGYVQAQKAAGQSAVSVALKSLAASSPFVSFNSKEASTNRPQLLLWTTQAARNALFVTGSSNLSTSDATVKTRLESLGFTVTVKVASNQLVTADADGKALVVISSTSNASNVTTKFRHVVVPVVSWEFDVHDDLAVTGAVLNTDFGTSQTAQTALSITDAAHAMAAGKSGTVTVHNTGTSSLFSWGLANANAAKIASLTGDAMKSVIFGYDSGATMPGPAPPAANLEAPARRVALFMTDTTAQNLNSDGLALIDAALKWATEINTSPTINLLTPASGPVATVVTISGSNFGQAQGTSTVSFNGVLVSPSSWMDGTIVVAVPPYAMTGLVVVKVNGVSSNGVTFTVGEMDSDGDGLADWWEMQYFGNLNQTATGDPDGDGINNLQEFQQGRNPTVNALVDDAAINLKVFTPLASPTP